VDIVENKSHKITAQIAVKCTYKSRYEYLYLHLLADNCTSPVQSRGDFKSFTRRPRYSVLFGSLITLACRKWWKGFRPSAGLPFNLLLIGTHPHPKLKLETFIRRRWSGRNVSCSIWGYISQVPWFWLQIVHGQNKKPKEQCQKQLPKNSADSINIENKK